MNRKPLIIMLGVVAAAGISLFAAGCSDDEDPSITYNPGDSIVDISGDVEYTVNTDDGSYTYTGSMYKITYLLENESLITLEGTSLTDLEITGYSGDITALNLYEIESDITVDEQQISISGIADGAFSGCTTLASVDLTKKNQSVEFSIGERAFYNCSALESVTMPSSTDVYSNNNEIGSGAFYSCTSLATIEISDRFSSVGSYAFANCTSLTSATLSPRMTTIADGTFGNTTSLTSVSIPTDNRLATIGSSAFYQSGITSFDFSAADFVYIGSDAFAYSGLTSVTLPSTVTYVGSNAFADCLDLSSAAIPFMGYSATRANSLTNIFGSANSEDRVTMSLAITNATGIPSGAFSGMSYLGSVRITMGSAGIYYTYGSDGSVSDSTTFTTDNLTFSITSNMFYNCSSLTSISIPTVTGSIGSSAFYNCSSLTSFTPNISPSYSEETGLSTFSIESSAFFGCTSLSDSIFNYLDGVTSIGNYAFAYCKAFVNVVIPDSVTSLDSNVFYNCEKIASLTVESLNYSYENSYGYTYTSTLFSNVSSLFGAEYADDSYTESYYNRDYNFYSANGYAVPYSLTEVTISNISSVPASMFRGMASLEEVTLNFASTSTSSSTTSYSIGSYAFYNCTNLADVALNVPEGDTVTIGTYAFYNCESLTNESYANIVESATSIDQYAFAGCSSLTSVTIPDSVTSLGSNVFYNCPNIESLTIENYNDLSLSSSYIGNLFGTTSTNYDSSYTESYYREYDFYYAYSSSSSYHYNYAVPYALTEVTVNNISSVTSYMFYGVGSVEEVTLNFAGNIYGSYSIGDYAFYNCSSLEVLNISGNVTSIGQRAFYGCENLTDAIFDDLDSVTSIGTYAFAYCSTFENVVIPSSVTYVGSNVFYNCENIASLEIENYTTLSTSNYSTSNISHVDYLFGASSYDGSYTEGSTSNFYTAYSYAVPYALTEVTVSNMGNSVPNYMFYGVSSVEEITINFIEYSAETTYSIGSYAFYNCSSLDVLTLNVPANGIISVYSTSFSNCGEAVYTDDYGNTIAGSWVISTTQSGTEISLSEEVTGIASGVFSSGITSVTFDGTEAEWAEVNTNGVIFAEDCTVTCSDTETDEEISDAEADGEVAA